MVRDFLRFVIRKLKRKKDIQIGLYGPPNGGKTTLANKICNEYLGEDMGTASNILHETREIVIKEKIVMKKSNKWIKTHFNLVDTPGISTKIDYEDFVKKGIKSDAAKSRAKEATKGVIESIKWMDKMDLVIMVLDASKDPYTQVNITIIGNLQARKIPVILIANKIDLKKSKLQRIESAFPQYDVIGISAKSGKNMGDLYDKIVESVASI